MDNLDKAKQQAQEMADMITESFCGRPKSGSAYHIQKVESARRLKCLYELILDDIAGTDSLGIHTIAHSVEITDPDIVGAIRTLLHLKCSSLSKVIDTPSE